MVNKYIRSQMPLCPLCDKRMVGDGTTTRGRNRYKCMECNIQPSNLDWYKKVFTVQERYLILFLHVSGAKRVNIAKMLNVKPVKVARCIKSLQKELGNKNFYISGDAPKIKADSNQYFASNRSIKRYKKLLLEVKLKSHKTKSIIALFSEEEIDK